MVFVEASIFTKRLMDYFNDNEYREFQNYLMEHPGTGDIIQGTGGLRKIRWTASGKGKRGGTRIIYYWEIAHQQIYLLTLYAKNEMSDLSANDKKVLKEMLERW